ncbi:sensor histidine kinase [Umezawaea beigongshangensis]|uniref:sensor histidine kinase n=1 Tax=Umezawaea beigongshangensis TaxID=2780383 RepID=UPI0018F23C13|nr:sensor histidine kinase [Umezawaea beigongshangensis]
MTTRTPHVAATAGYLLLNLVTGIFWFVLLVTMLAVSTGLLVVWVGVPLLVLTLSTARGAAHLERAWVRAALGVDVPPPYRPSPRGGVLARARVLVSDPATWREVAYFLLLLPLGVVEFALVVAMISGTAGLIALPVTIYHYPFDVHVAGGLYVIDGFFSALPVTGLGVLLGYGTLHVLRFLGRTHGALASALLGPSQNSVLAAEAARLHASRARGVEAAEAERRRIERDLHDGAQQRLVAVAMGLGRARTKLDSEPEAARELIAEAHADAKLAISELRDLARGIYPSVLGDRGLDAALSSLAAKCPVPVDLTVDVEPRPPTAVESAAYFTVAEALTNVGKYANATRAEVTVRRVPTGLLVEVVDDGRGGAEIRPGGGLAGLADRAATIDGVVVVLSPVGGPTVIRAELPCAW